MNDLQVTRQHSPLIKLDHKLERIAVFHEQTALNPDAILADIQNLARCRERPALQTTAPDYLNT
jgi:hypothetical protein